MASSLGDFLQVDKGRPTLTGCGVFRACSFGRQVPAGVRLLVYGDSMTAGFPSYEPYGGALRDTLGGSTEVTGCGLCGATTAQILSVLSFETTHDGVGRECSGLLHLLKKERPFDLVILMAGTNDIPKNITEEETVLNLQAIHLACHREGASTVAIGVPDCAGQDFPEWAIKRKRVNSILETWCLEEGSKGGPFDAKVLLYVNPDQLLPFSPETIGRGLWYNDQLHFSSSGCWEFGKALADFVAPLTSVISHITGTPASAGAMKLRISASDSNEDWVKID